MYVDRCIIILCVVLRHECSSSVLEWIGWKKQESLPTTGVPLLDVPFEELGPEEKFLVEANKITGLNLSQLDVCQHKQFNACLCLFKQLIMKIKASCGTLSDEVLSKLAVNLLNCQADTEGRRTYPCTEDMSLKSCTMDMDGETWNGYHLMTNRARAVCYIARQEQFVALSEMTVNRLMEASRNHIHQVDTLTERQEVLGRSAEVALTRLSRSQKEALDSHSLQRRLQSRLEATLEEDLGRLEQLGRLIDSGGSLLVDHVAQVKAGLEDALKELSKQRKEKMKEHEKVQKDMSELSQLVQALNEKLKETDLEMMNRQKQMNAQTAESSEHTSFILKTLVDISQRLSHLQDIVQEKSSLVVSVIGENGELLDWMVLLGPQLVVLFAAMLVSCFISSSALVRLIILAVPLLHAYLSITSPTYTLSLDRLYAALATLAFVDLCLTNGYTYYLKYKRRHDEKQVSVDEVDATKGRTSQTNLSRTQEHDWRHTNGMRQPLSKVDQWLLSDRISDRLTTKNGYAPPPHFSTPVMEKAGDPMEDACSIASGVSARRRRITTYSVTGSEASSKKIACCGLTQNGQRCRLAARPGQATCRLHEAR